jgi:hypothetical protein
MKFSNLAGQEVSPDTTAIYTFYELPGEPWLRVRPAGDLNRAYFGAVLAASSKNRKRLMRGKIDAAMLEENRQLDRKLYPQHVDGGAWGGWLDDETGEAVPYSKQGFQELCEQLPADLFDELRAFCNQAGNFRSQEQPDAQEIDETAKN